MPDLRLEGCSPEPLAHYLKALGVLRLVGEQADRGARGFWSGDCFVLRSALDEPALLDFFGERYAPTPLISPWNGGSGFFAGDQRAGIDAIAGSTSPRLAAYRRAIDVARRVLERLHLDAKPEKDQKPVLVEHLRSELDDDALTWLDAALVLTDDGLRFPPLLGTGGNDGRLEFANNHMQRLAELLDAPAPGLLRGALFGEPTAGLAKGKAIGQFLPAGTGGANAGPGYTRDSFLNAWDFVLMLEGAILFGAAVTRRLEAAAPGTMAFPFTVRASASGYGSSAASDEQETRDELWLPLWQQPASVAELRALLSEGRAKVRLGGSSGAASRPVGTGVDFARAIAGLGVDRGLHSFVRFGFHVRNGLSYLATPLGRWRVPEVAGEHVELLTPIDRWLDRFRRAATSAHAPASHGRALRRLESAILALCQDDTRLAVQAVLIALGEAEAAIGRVRGDALQQGLRPIPLLPTIWLERCDDGSAEFRLAAALASADLRPRLVPIRRGEWMPRDHDDGRTVWGDGDLVRNLLAVLLRADVERSQHAMKRGASDMAVPETSPTAPGDSPTKPGPPGDSPDSKDSPPKSSPVSKVTRSENATVPKDSPPESSTVPKDSPRSSPVPRDSQPRRFAALPDLAAFIEHRLDDARIETLARGLALLDWRSIPAAAPSTRGEPPPAAFAALALALDWSPDGQQPRRTPGMLARAAAGDLAGATSLALRRLQGYGLRTRALLTTSDPPTRAARRSTAPGPVLDVPENQRPRLAAALAFPLARHSYQKLLTLLLPRHDHEAATADQATP